MTSGLSDIRGKVARMTGGTRGVGCMIAKGIVEAGVRTHLASRSPDARNINVKASASGSFPIRLISGVLDESHAAFLSTLARRRVGKEAMRRGSQFSILTRRRLHHGNAIALDGGHSTR
jgi:NAD(P)-dependent dehydrogenase (short-subunit alcohol dehydrogenase family)